MLHGMQHSWLEQAWQTQSRQKYNAAIGPRIVDLSHFVYLEIGAELGDI